MLKVTTAVYLRLGLNYDFSFSSYNSGSLNLECQTKKVSLDITSSPLKIWGKSVKGFMS